MTQDEGRTTITARDLKVVSALQCNGRMTMQALADKIGISVYAATESYKRLTDAGIMTIVPVCNPLSLGNYSQVLVGLRINGNRNEALAMLKAMPQVTYVADIQKDGNTLTVKRMLEDGYMMVKVQTPCLLTCIKELNQPRYMSVNGIFTCYDKPMEVFDYNALKDDPLIEVDTIGLKGSPTNVFKSFTPPQKGAGTMLTGDDTAAQLAGILAKKHLI